jgi:hypothetical protein
VLGTTDYYIVIAAKGVEAYQEVIERLSNQDSVKFDYITFPIARTVKSKYSMSLLTLLARTRNT